MIVYYRILGVLILLVCVVLAIVVYTQIDLQSVTTSNDFINAVLHSPGVVSIADRAKLCAAVFLVFAGLGIGSFCYGIGELMERLEHLRAAHQ